MKPHQYYFDEENLEKLSRLATHRGASRAAILRELVAAEYQRQGLGIYPTPAAVAAAQSPEREETLP